VDALQLFLGNIWFVLIGLMLVLYVVLDGFDLGVGILSLFACDEDRRGVMMASLGSVWDANETWLVVLGGALFGAFPLVYGVALHALYLPVMLMIFGLIFRGVAFEFHAHARRKSPWGVAFGAGSLIAAACQGLILGAVIGGLAVQDNRFVGGVWDWLQPFPLLVAAGVTFGYALLGATFLIIKTSGEIQQRSYHRARFSAWAMLCAAVAVTTWTPLLHDHIASKWFSLPAFFFIAPLPLGALLAFLMLMRSLHKGHEHAPFAYSLIVFLCSFAGLAVSLYPYLLPPAVTIADAAASPKTLVFMLTGIGMLLPIMLIYNGYQYFVFRGKVAGHGYQEEGLGKEPD
jgi:cytochrome d ubiquinol oxidase subunit II